MQDRYSINRNQHFTSDDWSSSYQNMAEAEPKQTSLQDELAAAEKRPRPGSTDSDWPQPILASIKAVTSVLSAPKQPVLKKKLRQSKTLIQKAIDHTTYMHLYDECR